MLWSHGFFFGIVIVQLSDSCSEFRFQKTHPKHQRDDDDDHFDQPHASVQIIRVGHVGKVSNFYSSFSFLWFEQDLTRNWTFSLVVSWNTKQHQKVFDIFHYSSTRRSSCLTESEFNKYCSRRTFFLLGFFLYCRSRSWSSLSYQILSELFHIITNYCVR